MIKNKSEVLFPLALLSGWIIVNLLSAGFTELEPDESYYWSYAQDMAWGYFDHPPMVAVFIKMGTMLFKNELGVRICSIALQALSFYFIYVLAGRPDQKRDIGLLALLVGSMPLLHFFGFVTTPDSPLLIFTAGFFLAYRNFIERSNWGDTILLGLVMALLLYSKYHGILLIGFTILSNLRIFKSPKFYIAGLLGIVLYTPHLIWQIQNEFPTWQYHLVGRTSTNYAVKNTLEFLLNQVLIFSPFLFPVYIITLFNQKKGDLLSRAYIWTIVGFWLFFLLNTFRGYAQPHWTALISIPLVLLTYRYARSKPKLHKTVIWLAGISVSLMLIIRLLIAIPPVKDKTNFYNKHWVQEIEAITKEVPVLFHNSYRDASLFAFYSGQETTQFSDIEYRKNQYDIWTKETDWHNQDFFFASKRKLDCPDCDASVTKSGFNLYKINKAQIFQKVEVKFVKPPSSLRLNQTLQAEINITNPYPFEIDLQPAPGIQYKVALWHLIRRSKKHYLPVTMDPLLQKLPADSTLTCRIEFTTPEELPHDVYLLSSGYGYSGLGPIIHEKCLVSIDRNIE
jgi:4-amino-4-deoxy-L-arabinose transferase-like glycosyltransferase